MTTRAFGWLIRGVFAQARASGLTAVLLTAIAAATAASLSLQWRGEELTVGFGWRAIGTGEAAVRTWLLGSAGLVADTAGVLLALLWTAGFIPTFVAPSSAALLLAKPPSRAVLLVGRFTGVVVYVAAMASAYVAATAVAVGSRTGVWSAGYWLAAPLAVVHFTSVFAAVALIAVSTKSTAACQIGAILFWLVCWGINGGRLALSVFRPEDAAGAGAVSQFSYWILPKPVDFGLILAAGLGVDLATLPLPKAGEAWAAISPGWSVASSLAFAVAMLALAIYEFEHADY